MIRFREPRLERTRGGNLSLLLTEAGTWESFESFAEKWTQQIGATILDRVDGPDARIWRISYEGQVLNLIYDDFPNGVSVEAIEAAANTAIGRLFSLVSSEAAEDGV